MMLASMLLLHGDNGRLDLIYFWSAVLIAALPVAVFTTIAVLATRGYFRRRVPDGGGEPPPPGDRRPHGLRASAR
ncbi:MAG: hypothetical protein HYS40_02205 [Gemmatimonadetes bacterium]|nr:hypothetical protein [Gemmatimonadota bacterium]